MIKTIQNGKLVSDNNFFQLRAIYGVTEDEKLLYSLLNTKAPTLSSLRYCYYIRPFSKTKILDQDVLDLIVRNDFSTEEYEQIYRENINIVSDLFIQNIFDDSCRYIGPQEEVLIKEPLFDKKLIFNSQRCQMISLPNSRNCFLDIEIGERPEILEKHKDMKAISAPNSNLHIQVISKGDFTCPYIVDKPKLLECLYLYIKQNKLDADKIRLSACKFTNDIEMKAKIIDLDNLYIKDNIELKLTASTVNITNVIRTNFSVNIDIDASHIYYRQSDYITYGVLGKIKTDYFDIAANCPKVIIKELDLTDNSEIVLHTDRGSSTIDIENIIGSDNSTVKVHNLDNMITIYYRGKPYNKNILKFGKGGVLL